jgi:hypothetical protein
MKQNKPQGGALSKPPIQKRFGRRAKDLKWRLGRKLFGRAVWKSPSLWLLLFEAYLPAIDKVHERTARLYEHSSRILLGFAEKVLDAFFDDIVFRIVF